MLADRDPFSKQVRSYEIAKVVKTNNKAIHQTSVFKVACGIKSRPQGFAFAATANTLYQHRWQSNMKTENRQ
jgi:hypothetical protein